MMFSVGVRSNMKFLSGINKDGEDELEELMPSCFCLNMLDCITMKLCHLIKPRRG